MILKLIKKKLILRLKNNWRIKREDDEYLDRFKYYAFNIYELMDKSKKRKGRIPKININSNDN